MSNYLEFVTEDNILIYVEIEESISSLPVGEIPAQTRREEQPKNLIIKAINSFDEALSIVKDNASAFIRKIREMQDKPDEVEITFGLKADGNLGTFAIAKIGMEAGYTVKLTWKKQQISENR